MGGHCGGHWEGTGRPLSTGQSVWRVCFLYSLNELDQWSTSGEFYSSAHLEVGRHWNRKGVWTWRCPERRRNAQSVASQPSMLLFFVPLRGEGCSTVPLRGAPGENLPSRPRAGVANVWGPDFPVICINVTCRTFKYMYIYGFGTAGVYIHIYCEIYVCIRIRNCRRLYAYIYIWSVWQWPLLQIYRCIQTPFTIYPSTYTSYTYAKINRYIN